MNLSFDINTQEGDKVIVSLVSSYPYLRDIAPAGIPDFELLEVSIIRDKGTKPVKMEIFGKIADILISIAEDNPDGILFYFCDIIEGIPSQRPNKTRRPMSIGMNYSNNSSRDTVLMPRTIGLT